MRRSSKNELSSLKTGLLYGNSSQSVFSLFIAALVIYLLSLNELSGKPQIPLWLSIWFSLFIVYFILRLYISAVYKKSSNKISADRFWRNIFYLLTALSGIGLGISVLFVSRIETAAYLVFIVLLLGAVSSGSVSTLPTSLTAFSIYNLLVLLPYSTYYFIQGDSSLKVVAIMTFSYFFILFLTAFRLNKALDNSLMLKIENDQIIEKLSQSEEKFSKSFYSGVAPMALLRITNGEFIDVNNAMLKLLGYSRNEIIGKNPYDLDLYNDTEDVIKIISETSDHGFIKNWEITLKTKKEGIRHCFVTIENFRLNNTLVSLVMLQDYTERIAYEGDLKLEKEKAEKAANAKSKFLATMSHEIRTPMNSIIGMTNLALMSDDINERNDYLNVVKDSADYLLALINDILNISKLESGKAEIEIIDTDLHEVLKKAFKTMELFALSKKLKYTLAIDNEVPRYVRTAPERLRQILLNLIGNSIKFTPQGSIEVIVSLTTGSEYRYINREERYIDFAVKDTGIGIPENKLEEIFESFTQADNSVFRKYGGTGLGLSISKQLVKMMQGDIKVESKVGEGTTFSFILPLVPGSPPSCEDEYTIDSETVTQRILIAEDNIMNQKLVTAYMKKLGLAYTIVENGLDAIKQLKSGEYTILLMDLEMPVLNGEEAMKRIRAGEAGEKYSHFPIYAMSAYNINEIKEKCLREGFTGYITKPVDLKMLKNVLINEIKK